MLPRMRYSDTLKPGQSIERGGSLAGLVISQWGLSVLYGCFQAVLNRMLIRQKQSSIVIAGLLLLALGAKEGFIVSSASAQQARGCAIELTLAIDVSGSINASQYRLQVDGLADALSSPDIIQAIMLHAPDDVWISVVQWSGDAHQTFSVPWTRVHNADTMLALADTIRRQIRHYGIYSTAIGEALAFIGRPEARAPAVCQRRIIDVSGDGPSNEGQQPRPIRDMLVSQNVTINGLVILEKEPELQSYYRDHVIGGQGAFIVTANRFSDYPQAIRRKLLRELTPVVASLKSNY
ncbi:DUF1194 domain-containing protein [Coralliovum pocilloporae]|uniref:DUF1194 domain-containing protein n=1 Tax=Coralliovum pocilloporae TaxID=3066369 RepID=UPI0033079143